MLNKVSYWIKQKLQKFVRGEKHMQSALSFGVDMALYTIVSTAGLLLLSLMMDSLVPGIIIIATFYLNQTIGGGYHASTHMRCFLSMAVFLISGILLSKLTSFYILSSIAVLSGIVLLMYPVVLHPNRAFLKSRLPYFAKRSRCVTLCELLLVILFAVTQFRYSSAYIVALALSAISRIVAKHSKHSLLIGCESSNED